MAGNHRGRKRWSNANAICDRSGGKYPMREMVVEPGTGYLVHKSFSDGMWNLVDHPLNHIERYVRFGDPYPVDNARPDINWAVDLSIQDEDGSDLITPADQTLE